MKMMSSEGTKETDLSKAEVAEMDRAAVSHVVQGTAADMMKVALCRVAARLRHARKKQREKGGKGEQEQQQQQQQQQRVVPGASARLFLQLHDELVLSCSDNEEEIAAAR